MKAIRVLIGFVIAFALWASVIQPNLPAITGKLASLVGSNKLLQSIEDSALFPPPLRTALQARGGNLTLEGALEWTNYQRQQNQLPVLKENKLLDLAAANKMADMFEKQYFEHISPSGAGPSDLAKGVGYAYVVVGENLALGSFESDKALVEAWMNSPGHRANILNNRYQEIGIAVGKGMFEGREQWLAVQSFGLPLSACPSTDAELKAQLDNNQAQISSLQSQLAELKAEIDSANKKNSAAYNEKVNRYNTLVQRMNSLIDQTKILVAQYNAQVNSFNACLKE